MNSFESTLFRMDMKGGWTLAPVPSWAAPSEAGPWGRTPIRATVDGMTWDTSVWRDKEG